MVHERKSYGAEKGFMMKCGLFMNTHLTAGLMLTSFFLFSGCRQKDPKFEQYFVEGEQLYLKHCSNCHQHNGKGLGLVYPPLASSDFLKSNFEEVICMMKKGRKGPLEVNGDLYNQPMPGVPSLTELEIAEIATFIYNSWGTETGLIDVKRINTSLQPCLELPN